MTSQSKKKLQQALISWQKQHSDIKALRKAYQEKILDLVVKSMEFEKEPVDINRLKTLLKEKTAQSR
jgi:uncharacterized protein YeeX (DUF496 family)